VTVTFTCGGVKEPSRSGVIVPIGSSAFRYGTSTGRANDNQGGRGARNDTTIGIFQSVRIDSGAASAPVAPMPGLDRPKAARYAPVACKLLESTYDLGVAMA